MFYDLWGAVSPYASAVAKAASEVALQLRSGDPSADEGKSWRNLDEYTALVRAALASYHGGIVVEVVSDTLDFAGWLKPCTNKNLALFSRHGPENFHPGMHVVRFEAHDVAPAVAEAAPAAAVAACGPVMRSGAEAAAPLVRPERPAELSELEPASFALLTIEKTGNAGDVDLPLPCCLVQLPDALPPGFNSQDPAAKISVRWWQPHGGYAAKWTPWFEGSRQSQTDVLRGALAVANVQMWGGLKQPQQAAARALGPDFRIIDSCLTPAWAFNFNPHATSFLWAVINIIGSSVHMQGMVRGNLRFEVTEFRRSS